MHFKYNTIYCQKCISLKYILCIILFIKSFWKIGSRYIYNNNQWIIMYNIICFSVFVATKNSKYLQNVYSLESFWNYVYNFHTCICFYEQWIFTCYTSLFVNIDIITVLSINIYYVFTELNMISYVAIPKRLQYIF